MTQGKFISFEGIECAGKSTQVLHLCEYLKKLGIQVCKTREPGLTKLADSLRGMLVAELYDIPPVSELLMMFAGRASHVQQLIQPKLEAGYWVLCDRFVDASYAYQGAGRGISENVIATLDQLTTQGLRPDLTFLLDLPLKNMTLRMQQRADAPDRIESEKMEFFGRVREKYLDLAQTYPDRYVVIDAMLPLGYIQSQMIEVLKLREYI